VCLQYLLFFGVFASDEATKVAVDVACLVAFCSFSAAWFIGERLVSTRTAKAKLSRLWPVSSSGRVFEYISKGHMVRLTFWVALVASFYTVASAFRYGGFEASLVHFYRSQPGQEPSWLDATERVRPLLTTSCLWCIGLLRLQYLIQKALLTRWLFIASIAFYLLLVYPIGSAGNVFVCGMIVLFTDAIMAIKRRHRWALHADTMVLIGILIVLGGVLQAVRSEQFRDLRGVYYYLVANSTDVGNISGQRLMHSHTSIPDWTALCLNEYGGNRPFLWFYTPYTLVVAMVPRQVWPGKPVGFGKILAEPSLDPDQAIFTAAAHPGSPSFAAGLAGEGYANGGYLGLLMLSVLLGLGCGVASRYAVVGLLSDSVVFYTIGLCCRNIPPLFVRGDMMSAFGASVVPLVVVLVLLYLYRQLVPVRHKVRRAYSPRAFNHSRPVYEPQKLQASK
jgi:hypothetical protein